MVVNLAGASIFTRWTAAAKKLIRESRILTTRNVVDALPAGAGVTLVSTSAVGYYGFHGDEELGEDAGAGSDFLARLCVDWEAEARRAAARGARVVITRFGIVLGPGGGVLGQMAPLFRLGLGGPPRLRAAVVLVDPRRGPLRRRCSTWSGAAARRGAYNFDGARAGDQPRADPRARPGAAPPRVPAGARPSPCASRSGEFGNVVLKGQRVLPRRLLAEGFRFAYPRWARRWRLAPPL